MDLPQSALAFSEVRVEAAHRAFDQVLGKPAEKGLVGQSVEPGWSDPVISRDSYPDGTRGLLFDEPTAGSEGAFDVVPLHPSWRLDHRDGADYLMGEPGGAQGKLQLDARANVFGLCYAGWVKRAAAAEAVSPFGEASHVEEGGEDSFHLDPGHHVARPERPVFLRHR